jgi:hypothetical protein
MARFIVRGDAKYGTKRGNPLSSPTRKMPLNIARYFPCSLRLERGIFYPRQIFHLPFEHFALHLPSRHSLKGLIILPESIAMTHAGWASSAKLSPLSIPHLWALILFNDDFIYCRSETVNSAPYPG